MSCPFCDKDVDGITCCDLAKAFYEEHRRLPKDFKEAFYWVQTREGKNIDDEVAKHKGDEDEP